MARISRFRKELLIGSAGILLTLPGLASAGTVSGVVSDPSDTRGLQSVLSDWTVSSPPAAMAATDFPKSPPAPIRWKRAMSVQTPVKAA